MVINITRKMLLNKYEYNIGQNSSISAESSFDYGILPRKIIVEGNNIKYTMLQSNWLLKILMLIPKLFIPIELFPEYKMFFNDELIGKTKVAFFTPRKQLIINNSLYELYLHSNNYISIMKDDVQIALVKKSHLTFAEQNQYDVEFNYTTESDMVFIVLMVAFADIVFFPNQFKFDFIKYEKTIGKDKMLHRTFWKSKK